MNITTTLILADDHPVLLNGLKSALEEFGYSIVGTALNGTDAFTLLLEKNPSIAILDIEMPFLNAFEIISKATQIPQLQTKFILLSYHSEKSYVLMAQQLNISGYLLKDEKADVIHNAIQVILKGGTYFSSKITTIQEHDLKIDLKKISYLTPSERTILRLISQRLSSREISERLTISIRTVQKHRANIIDKLELNSQIDTLSIWVEENKALLDQL
jgi:two-component system nitrate/nitrite response regulator NarL